jgi:hypothetical protein
MVLDVSKQRFSDHWAVTISGTHSTIKEHIQKVERKLNSNSNLGIRKGISSCEGVSDYDIDFVTLLVAECSENRTRPKGI